MVIVACFLAIMTAVIAAWLSATTTDSRLIARKIEHTAALYLAEAGAEHSKEWLTAQAKLGSGIIRTEGTIPASTVLGAQSVQFGGGSYTTSIAVTFGSWSIPIYTITSVGTADPDGTAGSGDEVSRKIIVQVLLGSFARYAYFTNNESSNIWFITTDALLGLVHTNGSFHIAGKPDFWGKVTSVGDRFSYYNNGSTKTSTLPNNGTRDVPHFRDGYELGADSVTYPTDMSEIEAAAEESLGLVIDSDTEITLGIASGNQGTLTYTQQEEQQVWHDPETRTASWRGWRDGIYHATYYRETYTIPGYFTTETVTVTHAVDVFDSNSSPSGKAVVYVNGDAEVSGTLAGQLTILTQGDLIVTGNIHYRVDPVDYDADGLLSDPNGNEMNDAGFDRNGDGVFTLPGEKADDTDDDGNGTADTIGYDQPESTDTLGLVAKGDVVVADDGGGAIDRKISATVMALGTPDSTGSSTGSFRVENYTSHMEGTLTIVGGLIQKQRGAVGTFSGDITGQPTKTSGYSKNYIYDRRVLYFPPPYFPPTTMFDLIYWQEVAP
jgi:hypothetical protein